MDSKKTFAQTNLVIRIAIGTQGFYLAPSIVVTLQNQYIDTLKSIRFQMFFFCFHYKKQVCGGDVDCLFSITHRRHRRPHQPVSSHSKIRPFRRWRRWWVNILQIIAVVRDIELEHTSGTHILVVVAVMVVVSQSLRPAIQSPVQNE